MHKRALLIVAAIAAAIATGGVLIFAKKSGSIPSLSLSTVPSISPTPSLQPKLLTWDDPAGFTFQYPEGLLVNKHEEDNNNYAHVELTNKDHPGSLIVWAKDTTSADVAAWAATEKSFTGAPVLDTTLGSKPAKKVVLASPDKLVTGAIVDELLFMIETNPADKVYWMMVHDQVANSFTFPGAPQAGGSSGAADGAVDETETVQ